MLRLGIFTDQISLFNALREEIQKVENQILVFTRLLGLDYYVQSDVRNALNHLYRSVDLKMRLFDENDHTDIARVSGHITMMFITNLLL